MNVDRKTIQLDRGTLVIICRESLDMDELASFDPKKTKMPQSYILIGTDEQHLSRIDGIELELLSSIIQIVKNSGMGNMLGNPAPLGMNRVY